MININFIVFGMFMIMIKRGIGFQGKQALYSCTNVAWLRNLKKELGTQCFRVWRWEQAVVQCLGDESVRVVKTVFFAIFALRRLVDDSELGDVSVSVFAVQLRCAGHEVEHGTSVKKGEDCQGAKHHFRTVRTFFDGCADRWNEGPVDHKCMQENSRTYETMDSWDTVATHQMTPQ